MNDMNDVVIEAHLVIHTEGHLLHRYTDVTPHHYAPVALLWITSYFLRDPRSNRYHIELSFL